MNVPEQVKNEARPLIEQYGDSFDYLGNREGQEAYLFRFPDDATVGFPFLYLFKDGEAMEVTGPGVFDFIDLYTPGIEDADEVGVE
ncbi:hypothetical protein LI160_13175 [Bacteroides xylanisolvens]|jgi:hypothetical protein|uniref:DUF3298 domain-containing protein n=1 Tax=Phocaeicola vulgatus TaxID=821 RepID=A0AAW5BGP4_PHOVU|nr:MULTISPECIES: hypothetical protein [Bacteroidaceae]MCB6714544.1 hypothetical protein [Bacteroides xylanisolvens]MCB6734628.1 hypothetical protein [Bacteroides xylanisolvens]MCB7007617.1 hypothetical protein [Bacteroides thetaiotaomicron]MCB7121926.1 hypothetical protein [Bacteroides xylanisolvens]MCB7363731.1 hypothetical protein [Bacteroides thetaiotaomicron]